ncbi:MAG TPA: GNAT family protein [Allosphingosinicella sp.]|nr:GNAT family protein [Allosphingosinicella sp.]
MIFARSERLLLRRPRETDLEPLLSSWTDAEAVKYVNQREDVRAFLVGLIGDMKTKVPGDQEPSGAWYQYVAERTEDGAVVGDIGVGFFIPGEWQVELGYRILPAHRRRGYAKEALAALIAHLIEAHGIHRFVGVAASGNAASIAVLRSLGFRREGSFRQSYWCNGAWLDDEYFALLASEWRG